MTCSVPLHENGTLKDATLIKPDIIEPTITKPSIIGGGSLDEATAKDFVRDMCAPLAECISKILESTWLENIMIRGLELDGSLVMSETTTSELYAHIVDRVKETSGEVVGEALKEELDLKLKHIELTGHATIGETASVDIYNAVAASVKEAARGVAETVVAEILAQPLDLTLHGSTLTGGVTLDEESAATIYNAIVGRVQDSATTVAKDLIEAALKGVLKVELSDSKFSGRLTIEARAAKDIFQAIEPLLGEKYTEKMFKDLIQDILDAGLSNVDIDGSTLTNTALHGHLNLDAQALLDLQNALDSWVDTKVAEQVAILGESLRLTLEDTLKVYIDNKWELDFGTFVECSLSNAIFKILGHPVVKITLTEEEGTIRALSEDLVGVVRRHYDFFIAVHDAEPEHYFTLTVPVLYDGEGNELTGGQKLYTKGQVDEIAEELYRGKVYNTDNELLKDGDYAYEFRNDGELLQDARFSIETGKTQLSLTYLGMIPDPDNPGKLKRRRRSQIAIGDIPTMITSDGKRPKDGGFPVYSVEEIDELLKNSGGGVELLDREDNPVESGTKIPTYDLDKSFVHGVAIDTRTDNEITTYEFMMDYSAVMPDPSDPDKTVSGREIMKIGVLPRFKGTGGEFLKGGNRLLSWESEQDIVHTVGLYYDKAKSQMVMQTQISLYDENTGKVTKRTNVDNFNPIPILKDSSGKDVPAGGKVFSWDRDEMAMQGADLEVDATAGEVTFTIQAKMYNPDTKEVTLETSSETMKLPVPVGSGTVAVENQGESRVVSVRKSAAAGNLVELRSDGIAVFAGDPPPDISLIFVDSVNGSDTPTEGSSYAHGSRYAPFATLRKALLHIRPWASATTNTTIYLQCDGEYELGTFGHTTLPGAHVTISTYGDPVYDGLSGYPSGYEWRNGAEAIRPKLTLGWTIINDTQYQKASIFLGSMKFVGLHMVVAEPPQDSSQSFQLNTWVKLQSSGTIDVQGCIIEQMQSTSSVPFSCSGGMLLLNCVRLDNLPTLVAGRQLVSSVGLINAIRSNATHAGVEESGIPPYTALDDNVRTQKRPASSWVRGAAVDTGTKTMFGFTTTWDIFAQADQ